VNVAEVFYFASKAVLHPTAPVFDAATQVRALSFDLLTIQQLTIAATKALERIFQICDKNKNGLLDDGELNDFQRRVFGSPLQQQELDGVKAIVRSQMPDAVVDNCVTVQGNLSI
jgi:Ras family protein T1